MAAFKGYSTSRNIFFLAYSSWAKLACSSHARAKRLMLPHSKCACNAGPQAPADGDYSLAINVLGIVAVLIANITYLGYVTPPGGSHPSWEACDYKVYIAFFVLNGLAFIFSLCAIWFMIFMPLQWLLAPGSPSILRHETIVWWGAVTVGFAMLCLLAAFTAAGLVSVGFGAPDYTCGILPCESGGVYCSRHSYARESRFLNKFKGRCYQVFKVTSGAYVKANTLHREAYTAADASDSLSDYPGFDISFPDRGTFGIFAGGQTVSHDLDVNNDTCYFWGREVLSGFDDSNYVANNTLCMVPSAFPDGGDARGGLAFDLFTVLAKESIVSPKDRAIWSVNFTANPYICDTQDDGSRNCTESHLPNTSWVDNAWVVPTSLAINRTMCDSLALQHGIFSFFSDSSSVYIIDRVNGVENYDFMVDSLLSRHNVQYKKATFADAATVIVHDELPYRCQKIDKDSGDATWCRYLPDTQAHDFDGTTYKSTPRCPEGHNKCKHLAVEADGSYIQLSNLAKLVGDGNHVLLPPSETVSTVYKAVFSIFGIGVAVNVGILMWFLYLVGFLPWLSDLRRADWMSEDPPEGKDNEPAS